MRLADLMFIDRYPSIDLHGYDRMTARVAINDFIQDNVKMKNRMIVIIHGVGSGIIRDTTWETLKKNKNVLDYKSDYMNRGCTIAELDTNR